MGGAFATQLLVGSSAESRVLKGQARNNVDRRRAEPDNRFDEQGRTAMPTVVSDKTQEATQPLAPGRKPTAGAAPSREGMRKSLRGVGYEEGARALSPRPEGGPPPEEASPKAAEDERKAVQRQSYEALLGQLLGGKLYEVVTKNTTPDQVMKYALKAVDALIKAASDQVGKADGLDAESQKAAGALVEVLGQILREQAEAYLASQEGQDLAQKVSRYVAEHPGVVVAAILLAAAGAIAANVTIPEIAAKTSLGRGVEAEVQAKLGKVRDIALESILARIRFESGRFKAQAGVGHKEGQGTTGTVAASYGDETGEVSSRATVDKDGLLSAQVGLRGQKDKVSGSAGVTWNRGAGTTADATLAFTDKEQKLSGAAKYDFDKGLLSVRLSREVHEGLASRSQSLVYEGGKVSSEEKVRVEKDRNALELTRTIGPGGEVNTGLQARYSARDLTVALNAAFGASGSTVGASVEGHPKEGMLYEADATYSLSDSRLLNYGVVFGFQDPKKFEGFLLEYRRNNAPQVPEDQFRATLEFTIQQMMFRGQNETVLKGGQLSSGTASAHAAYPLGKDVMLIGGVTQGYGPDRSVGTMPQVGLQIRNLPVLVGYDMNSKAWTLRLTIPFGRK